MRYGNLDGLNKRISRLVLGTMVCNTDDLKSSCELLDAFVAAGGTCLDMAYVYAGGKSEQAVGEWLRQRGNRDQLVLLDKGAHPKGAGPRVNPQAIKEDIGESLMRLGIDSLDIWMLHRDDPTQPVGPILEALNAEVDSGRIRVFGASNWSIQRLDEAMSHAEARDLRPFAASSPQLSLAIVNEPMWPGCVSLDTVALDWYRQRQMPLFAWSSQANGFFTGRYRPEDTSNSDMVRVYYNEENWARLRRAQEIAEKKGCTANNVAAAYVLCQSLPVFSLIGPANPAELATSLPALDVNLTREELLYLERGKEAVA